MWELGLESNGQTPHPHLPASSPPTSTTCYIATHTHSKNPHGFGGPASSAFLSALSGIKIYTFELAEATNTDLRFLGRSALLLFLQISCPKCISPLVALFLLYFSPQFVDLGLKELILRWTLRLTVSSIDVAFRFSAFASIMEAASAGGLRFRRIPRHFFSNCFQMDPLVSLVSDALLYIFAFRFLNMRQEDKFIILRHPISVHLMPS